MKHLHEFTVPAKHTLKYPHLARNSFVIFFIVLAVITALSYAYGAEPAMDYKYAGLFKIGAQINRDAEAWNAQCGQPDPDTESECATVHKVLSEEFTVFIHAAAGYKSEGTDCRAKVRQDVIEHLVHLFTWNRDRAGKPSTPAAAAELDAIVIEGDKVFEEMKSCTGIKL